MKKHLFLFVIYCIFFSGCALSQHHVGYHYLGENHPMNGWSIVSKNTYELVGDIEKECIKYILTNDMPSFRKLYANRLNKKVNDKILKGISSSIDNYQLSGNFEQIVLVPQSHMLDEGAASDPFDYYDYIGSKFVLFGKENMIVDLYIAKIDDEFKSCGFSIYNEKKTYNKDNHPNRYLYPESIDKAGIVGRHYKTIK